MVIARLWLLRIIVQDDESLLVFTPTYHTYLLNTKVFPKAARESHVVLGLQFCKL